MADQAIPPKGIQSHSRIRFFHQSHNTVHFGGLFTLKQWIFSSLKHDPVPRENKLYCFYVKNPPKRIALWDRENSQLMAIDGGRWLSPHSVAGPASLLMLYSSETKKATETMPLIIDEISVPSL